MCIRDSVCLIILCGLPASGKTLFAQRLAHHFSLVRLSPDEWMTDLGIDHGDEEFRALLEARLTRLGFELLVKGQSVILEYGFWGRSERDALREQAHAIGVPIVLYFLNVPFEELWRRLQERNQRAEYGKVVISLQELQQMARIFQPPDAAELALYDQSYEVQDALTYPLTADYTRCE